MTSEELNREAMGPARPFDRLHTRSLLIVPVLAIVLIALFVEFDLLVWLSDSAKELLLEPIFDGVLLSWIYLQCRAHKVDLNRIIGSKESLRSSTRLWAFCFPLILLVVGTRWFMDQVTLFIWHLTGNSLVVHMLDGYHPDRTGAPRSLLIGIVIMATFVSPAVEELLFRGILLHRWSTKWGLHIGLVATSIAFAIIHADILGAGLLAVVFSVAYIRSGTLFVPILYHVAVNAADWIWPYVGMPAESPFRPLCLLLGGVAVAVFLYRLWPSQNHPLPYDRIK